MEDRMKIDYAYRGCVILIYQSDNPEETRDQYDHKTPLCHSW